MLRLLGLALIVSLLSPPASQSQALTLLHVTVSVTDAEQKLVPVPNHALLISDEPPTAAPRRVITRADGTVDVRLRPGKYIIESDRPVAFQGTTYLWRQLVEIGAAGERVLELTGGNAEREPANATAAEVTSLESDPALLLPPWQDSIVTLWTPTIRAAGFVVDAAGLIATSHGALGTATAIEVQLSAAVKVAGAIVIADSTRDVAILRIDPAALGSTRAVPLSCAPPTAPSLVEGQQILTLATRLGQPGRVTSGTVVRVDNRQTLADIEIDGGGVGGPVFDVNGAVAGITAPIQDAADSNASRRDRHRIVSVDAACEVIARARRSLEDSGPPPGTRLPVEPRATISASRLKAIAAERQAQLTAYQTATADFDVTFITPPLAAAAPPRSAAGRARSSGTPADPHVTDPLTDFGNWSEYVADAPAVLLVRVSPKLAESFWTTVARGVARTQGIGIPPIRRVKASFLRMQAYCGDAEVTPIHPFQLERQVSATEALYEGLYVFAVDALAPACGTVKLLLYSEKDPGKPVTRTIDGKLLEQVWQDVAAYRDSAK